MWVTDPDVTDALEEISNAGAVTGYTLFVAALHHHEVYDVTGRLLSIADQAGQLLNFSYSTASTPSSVAPAAGLLLTVTDASSRQLSFAYNAALNIQQITLPDGGTVLYGYDTNTNLTSVQYPDGKIRQYVYNESSLTSGGNFHSALTGINDELGVRFETTSYDSVGRAISSSRAGGVESTQITYNSNGTATVQFPLGATSTMAYSAVQGVNKVASTSQNCGPQCGQLWSSRTYDANGYPITTQDFNNNTTATNYDANGLLTQEIDAQGQSSQRTTNFTWNDTLRVPLTRVVSDAAGNPVTASSWSYNATGQVTASCQAAPSVSGAASYACGSLPNAPTGVRQTRYTYCATVDTTQCPLVGLLLSIDGSRTDVADVTNYAYYLTTDESGCGTAGGACHRMGDLYQVTDAAGHTTTMVAYDKNGRLARSQDSNGVITDLTYTPRGWLHTSSFAGAVTTIDYNPTGTISKITDPDGVFISYTYDAAHRLTDITDALGNHIHYTLDAAGNKTKEDTYDSSNTLHRTLSRTYNTLGQLTAVVDGLSHTVFSASFSDSYDANGNLVHSADGLGIQRKQGYDALNRLVTTLDNYNGTDTATQNTQATYAYDAQDNLEGVTDPDGLSTTYDYDGLSNPKALHSPDTGTTQYQVDAAGNRIQQTDAKGIIRNTTYDALNRPVTVSYPDSTQNITYHYDEPDSTTGCSGSYPIGRLTRVEEVAVTTTYCYDARGNVVLKKQAQGSQIDTVAYTYTSANRLGSVTTPSGTVTQYSRDATGRISGVTVTPSGGAAQTVVSAISYLPFGPISAYTLGNGQAINRSYDANYQLSDLTSAVLNLHFWRDAEGNITGLSNTAGGSPVETYSYDPLYRLTAVNDASGNAIEAYTYSKTGDRLSKTSANGLATGTYGYQGGTHWLTSIGNAGRSYDSSGNTIGTAVAGDTFGFGYNDRSRLSLVQHNQATVATYAYNSAGERIAKVVTSLQAINQRFTYDEESQLIGEYGTTSRDYVWMDDLPVAVADSGAATAVNYIYADGLGIPRVIADVSGNVIWQWSYQGNAFGEKQPASVTAFIFNPRFPGQYFDAESGQQYNQQRDYDPTTGRYRQSDPIGLKGGMSTYGYVGASPLNATDYLGLQSLSLCANPANAEACAAAGMVPEGGVGKAAATTATAAAAAAGANALLNKRADDAPGAVCKPAVDDVQGRDLCEQLALAEAKAGAGEPIMGSMGDEPRLIAHYGPGPWVK
ncbi:MAG TPA: RHS repeat-associated core domain-containing protein, partial [Dyella sp.]|uniref:RHS repeat-associated core domain-containing protein n=1 Tax=Dyella sp. TaxID=1869338 RepID=UPI002F94CF30